MFKHDPTTNHKLSPHRRGEVWPSVEHTSTMLSRIVFKMRSDLATVRSCVPAISCAKSCLNRGTLVESSVEDGGVVEKSDVRDDDDDDDDDNSDKHGCTGIRCCRRSKDFRINDMTDYC
jgi:hypothetical protein